MVEVVEEEGLVVEAHLDPVEDHLEDGEAAAQPLPCEEVPLPGDLRLLGSAQLLDVRHDLERRVLRLQPLLLRLRLLPLLAEGPRQDVLEGSRV